MSDWAPTERLMAELRQMAALESVRVEPHPVASDPADAISRVAAEEDADLIGVGQGGLRRPGGGGDRFGSTR